MYNMGKYSLKFSQHIVQLNDLYSVIVELLNNLNLSNFKDLALQERVMYHLIHFMFRQGIN